jgi:hypothetical protein
MAVQDIRIKYLVDNIELIETDKILGGISKEEEEVAKNATKMSTAIKKGSTESKNSVNDLNGSIKAIGVTILAAFTVDKIIAFGLEVVRVRGEFQKLEAVLTNTLGSQSKAQAALGQIKDFAAKTNFGVLELTTSFVKLANQGFVPTTNELRKLADVANSTGKSFDQLTEAIIDAQTGEFERLKEFGIRASKQGDQVTFAFKGVQTQTQFTSSAIREYILSLGDLNGVAGATEAISKTLGGQTSNLGVAYDSLLNTIGIRLEPALAGLIGQLSETLALTDQFLETASQAGQKQKTQRESQLKAELEDRIKNQIDFDIILKKSFNSELEARKSATKFILDDLKDRQEREIDIVRGKSISETLAIRENTKERIAIAEQYYKELIEKELALDKEKADKLSEQQEKEAKKKFERDVKDETKRLKALTKLEADWGKSSVKQKVELTELDKQIAEEAMESRKVNTDETINLIQKEYEYSLAVSNAKRDLYYQEQQTLGNLAAFIRASFGESKELMFAAFLLEKIQAVSSVILNSAKAQTAAIAASTEISTLNPVLGAAYLAKQTALINVNKVLQLGTIGALTIGQASQTFAKGGYTGDERGYIDHTGEMVAGIVHKKEFVFDRNKTSRFRPLFEAIHRGELTENDIVIKNNNTNSFDYTQMASAYKQALKGQTKADIHLDERGFTKYMVSESKRQEVRNKRYSTK